MSEKIDLPLDAFIRTIKVNRKSPHAVFLGAGASISSNVLSANTCIWEWKREIFLSSNSGISAHFSDLTLYGVQNKIQKWLDAEGGYPPLNSPEEYTFYVEKCYKSPTARRQYFQHLIALAQPHVSYHMLCLLAEEGIVRSVWTSNFDQLTARAAGSSKITCIEIGLDTPDRIIRLPQEGELLCVALHGDYRYDSLKNTEEELRKQDEILRAALVRHLIDQSLIVIGYSGRDASIMDALTEAYSNSGAGVLYWCGYGDITPAPAIQKLIESARQHKREAYYIPCGTGGFDDVLQRLSMHCLTESRLIKAKELHNSALIRNDTKSPPFAVSSDAPTGFIKSNSFSIKYPQEVYQFDCNYLKTEGAWSKLRDITKGSKVIAGLLKQKVLALGTLDHIKEVFKDKIDGKVTPVPVSEADLIEDNLILAMFRQAVVRALAEARGFNTNGDNLIWLNAYDTKREISDNKTYRIHEAAQLSLRWYSGKSFLVIEPTVEITPSDDDEVPKEIYKKLRNAALSSQYNSQFSEKVNEWLDRLMPKNESLFAFPPGTESIFTFELTRTPACATITGKGPTLPNVAALQKFIVWSGAEYQEPELIFSNTQGDGFVRDINPLRGMVRNQPYDFIKHSDGLGREIRLGVICPKKDEQRLSTHLNQLHRPMKAESTLEYLMDYPGFSQAFGLPLEIPVVGGNLWIECPEPDSNLGIKEGATLLRRNIINSIRRLDAIDRPNVVLIYIPQRWQAWRHYDLDEEVFDLHDFVKADCVQRGIATQLLKEETLNYEDQCRVVWFFSLAMYAKAMRTPWVLDSIDRDTAFVGLGYSQSSRAAAGKKIVLGSSHLYSPEGIGLSYRLGKIEDPIFDEKDWRQRNPFMSVDDARRVGESTRNQFFESGAGRLPKRVVIHKRTPFRDEEKRGLLQGLSGVNNIDMVELTVEPDLKFVLSVMKNAVLQADGFPVRRGTVVLLDDRRALLWVHGTTPAVNPNMKFYLGKRRIPSPLLITRHYGMASLNTLAREILGLSKMNWNNFEMYSKLPATIDSSNAIARIGSLLEHYGTALHDYRLFM